MDIYLEQNCPNLLEAIKESNYPLEDVEREPFSCILGCCTQITFDNFVKGNHDEIEAAIQFASMWVIDPNEWDLSTDEKRAGFALMYLAVELEGDVEDETETKIA